MTLRTSRRAEVIALAALCICVTALVIYWSKSRWFEPSETEVSRPISPIVDDPLPAMEQGAATGGSRESAEAKITFVVVDESQRPIAKARITRVDSGQVSQRTARGSLLAQTSDSGSAVAMLGATVEWPLHVVVEATGFLPEYRSAQDSSEQRFVLRRGLDFTVEVRLTDGTAVVDCPVLVSGSPLPDSATTHPWVESADVGTPLDSRSAIQRSLTDQAGRASFDGLFPGRVYHGVLPPEFISVRSEPSQVRAEQGRVVVTVDRVYVIALRTPGDTVRRCYPDSYPGAKLRASFGERMNFLARLGQERVGGGVCIVLVRKPPFAESELLAWEVPCHAEFERRGSIAFRARPVLWAAIDQAPLWDLSSIPVAQAFGEVALAATEPDQAAAIKEISLDLVSLAGASPGGGNHVVGMRGGKSYHLPAGTYLCRAAYGNFDGRLDVPREVIVEAGGRTEIPIKFLETFAPVRLYVVDSAGVSFTRGQWEFLYPERKLKFQGLAVGRFEDVTHWLPAGRLTARARVGPTDVWASQDMEIPYRWTHEPIDVQLEIGHK
jgi:hypothetical protein